MHAFESARFVFGGTTVVITDDFVATTLPGGCVVLGAPQGESAEYRATAARLGYADDVMRLCREHEVAHSALCHWLGLPESPVMRSVADGTGKSALTNLEEDAVLSLARFANAAGVDLLSALARLSDAHGPTNDRKPNT